PKSRNAQSNGQDPIATEIATRNLQVSKRWTPLRNRARVRSHNAPVALEPQCALFAICSAPRPIDPRGELRANPIRFVHFAELPLLLEISLHVLLIAASASQEERDLPEACQACFPPSPGRSGGVNIGTGADCCGATASSASANRDQFGRVVGRRGGEPRQQLPGATWKPGERRLQSQLSHQPRRRRCLRSSRRSAVSRLERGLR